MVAVAVEARPGGYSPDNGIDSGFSGDSGNDDNTNVGVPMGNAGQKHGSARPNTAHASDAQRAALIKQRGQGTESLIESVRADSR